MPRTATDTIAVTDRRGNVLVGKSIYIYDRGTTDEVPVYDAAVGGSLVDQPLITDDDGYVVVPGTLESAWVDYGLYDVVARGYWRHIHWDAGSPIVTAPTGAAGGDLAGAYPNPTLSPAMVALIASKVAKDHLVIDVTDHGVAKDLSAEIAGPTGPLQVLLNTIAGDRATYPQGVTIFFPPGRYLCNGSIVVPPGTFFRFVGSGAGWTDDTTAGAMQYSTELRRTPAGGLANTNAMFYAIGTGATVATRCNFTIEHMILCGRSSANGIIGGSLLQAGRTQNVWIDDVIFLDHEPDTNNYSVQIGGGFNGSFGSRVQFIACGADRNPLAVDGSGFSLAGAALGFTAWGPDGTINFDADALHFEGGKGVHMFLGSVGSPLLGPAGIKISKAHFERSSDSAGTNQRPHLVYGPSQSCSIGIAHFPLFRGRPAIWHEAGQAVSNTISQLIVSQGSQAPVSAPPYYVEVESGQLDIGSLIAGADATAGGPGTAYCRRKSTAGLGIGQATYDDVKLLLAIA